MNPDPIGGRSPSPAPRREVALEAARPQPKQAVGPFEVAADYGANAYHRFFSGASPNQAKVVASGSHPLNLKHPDAKAFSNLHSGAAYADAAYKRPTHLTPEGQFYIEKVRPADGKPPYDVVAVAGSNDPADWMKNASAWPRRTEEFGTVHAGFHDAFKGLKPIIEKELDPQVPLVLFGHSQGGAIAMQLGIELKRRGYDVRLCDTFGMPPPGGADFAARAAELPGLHVANEKDPIAYASPYSQVPGTRTLNRSGEEVPHRGFRTLARPDLGLMAHSVPRYRESIGNRLLDHPEPTPPGTPSASRPPSPPPADPA